MTPLSKIAEISRNVILYGSVGILALMVGRVVVGAAITWYQAMYPKVIPPTVGFGVIPQVIFPDPIYNNVTYELGTKTGTLGEFPDQMTVFFMPVIRPNLLAMERATADALSIGFKSTPERVSEKTYRWFNQSPIPTTLDFMIYDGRFKLKAAWEADPNFLLERQLPSQSNVVRTAKDFINKLGIKYDDLPDELAKIKYLRGSVGKYVDAYALADADFVAVEFFRSQFEEKYNFVTSTPNKGIVEVTVSGNPRAARYVQVDYNYFPIDYNVKETYPLKPVEQAYQELLAGNGYVAALQNGYQDTVIRKVELAYYDSLEPQEYMQPVYVFTGDHEFVGYVQAVREPKDGRDAQTQ